MKQENLNILVGFVLSVLSFALFVSTLKLTFESPTGLNIFLLVISTFLLSRAGMFYLKNLGKKIEKSDKNPEVRKK